MFETMSPSWRPSTRSRGPVWPVVSAKNQSRPEPPTSTFTLGVCSRRPNKGVWNCGLRVPDTFVRPSATDSGVVLHRVGVQVVRAVEIRSGVGLALEVADAHGEAV